MHAHQNVLIKTDILIKEEEEGDQMTEIYSDHENIEPILLEPTIEIKEEFVPDPCAIDIIDDKEANYDHKHFDEILVQPTNIEIKEECVADPLAIDIDDNEVKVKQER
jgi:hypothetical protein